MRDDAVLAEAEVETVVLHALAPRDIGMERRCELPVLRVREVTDAPAVDVVVLRDLVGRVAVVETIDELEARDRDLGAAVLVVAQRELVAKERHGHRVVAAHGLDLLPATRLPREDRLDVDGTERELDHRGLGHLATVVEPLEDRLSDEWRVAVACRGLGAARAEVLGVELGDRSDRLTIEKRRLADGDLEGRIRHLGVLHRSHEGRDVDHAVPVAERHQTRHRALDTELGAQVHDEHLERRELAGLEDLDVDPSQHGLDHGLDALGFDDRSLLIHLTPSSQFGCLISQVWHKTIRVRSPDCR